MKGSFNNIDEYIAQFPDDVRELLEKMRAAIQKAAPGAEEAISYGMPAFKYNGALVWFAAYKNHIGFYPTGSGIEAFTSELSGYKTSKGAVQFPIGKPLPLALVAMIVKFKVKENEEKKKAKESARKK